MAIKRRFEIKNWKYWQCWVEGKKFIAEWGRIGWGPRSYILTFDSDDDARTKMSEMIEEKLWRKNYEEVDSIEFESPDERINRILAKKKQGRHVKGKIEPLGKRKIIKFLVEWLKKENWDLAINKSGLNPPDLVASKGDEKWIFTVKGHITEAASKSGNFYTALGEILQKMDGSITKYSVILADLEENRHFWRQFSELAKRRTRINALFVDYQGNVNE